MPCSSGPSGHSLPTSIPCDDWPETRTRNADVTAMTTTVGAHDAKAHLSEYLHAASRGERIVVEQRGKPVAALVSIEDLRRLEQLDPHPVEQVLPAGHGEAAKEAQYRRAMEEAGLIVQYPSGEPVPREAYQPIEIEGPPLSEQIIADRR